MIPAGTRVRLRTTNGGDVVCWLFQDYKPTYGTYFVHHQSHLVPGAAGTAFYVEADRIASVEVVE